MNLGHGSSGNRQHAMASLLVVVLLFTILIGFANSLFREPVACASFNLEDETEMLQIVRMSFEQGHILLDVANAGNIPVTVSDWWINNVRVQGVVEFHTSNRLPLTVDANTTKYLAVRYSWISGYSYQAKLVSSKDNAFLYTATAPISDVSDALPIPVLYKANVNFYVVGNVKRIDLDIGNSGISDTNITHVYIGTSASTLQNQTITPVAVRAGADPSRITVNYDWAAGSTCYFKVIFSSGQSLDWPEQAPSDGTGFESQEITVVRTEPEDITVNVGDEFNVSVLIENVPPDNGMAGVQFTVNWDETVLKGIDLNEVLFHSAAAPEEQDNIWSLRNFVNDSSAESACLWISAQTALEAGYTPFSGNRTLAILVLKALKTGATTIHFSVFKIGNSDAEPLICAFNGEVNGLLKNVIIDGHVTVTDKELATRAPSENNETTYDQSSVPKTVFNENSGGFHPAETIVTFSAGFVTALVAISVFHVAHRKKKPIDGR